MDDSWGGTLKGIVIRSEDLHKVGSLELRGGGNVRYVRHAEWEQMATGISTFFSLAVTTAASNASGIHKIKGRNKMKIMTPNTSLKAAADAARREQSRLTQNQCWCWHFSSPAP